MEKNSILGLSKKLEQKQNEDQEQISSQTLNELRRHAKNLRDGLTDELGTTETAISGHLGQITKLSEDTRGILIGDLSEIERASGENRQAALNSIRWGWLKYSLPGLLICATFLIANWGMMQWQASRLASISQEIDQAQKTLNRLPQGVQFHQDGAGASYLIYDTKPEHYQTTSGAWVSKLQKQ